MITYNKIYEKKDGRKLVATGPRNLQNRQQLQSTEVVSTNSGIVEGLKDELKHIASTIGYTKDQATEMLNTAIEEVSIDLEKKYIFEIDTLKKSVSDSINTINELKAINSALQVRIDKKDDVILELTSKLSSPTREVVYESDSSSTSDRPSIDNIIIDPTERGAGAKMESHLTVKEVKSMKPKLASNINKLKELMGGLPKIK